MLIGKSSRGGPRRHIQLIEDITDMPVDRPFTREKAGWRWLCWCRPWRPSEAPEVRARSIRGCEPAKRRETSDAMRARSGVAPSRSSTAFAASSSSDAPSSSPRARHASPTSKRTRAPIYGASASCHVCQARLNEVSAARGSPSSSSIAPRAWAAIAPSTPISSLSAICSNSRQALRASSISPMAIMISTQAYSSLVR